MRLESSTWFTALQKMLMNVWETTYLHCEPHLYIYYSLQNIFDIDNVLSKNLQNLSLKTVSPVKESLESKVNYLNEASLLLLDSLFFHLISVAIYCNSQIVSMTVIINLPMEILLADIA